MSSDISRRRFNSTNDFNGVLMQQGRVQLDSELNEWNEMLDRRWRSETIDIIGRCAVPLDAPNGTANGFKIELSSGEMTIGRGRIYVDGLQAENHGDTEANLEFDSILAESRGVDPLPYDKQPYYKIPEPLPTTAGPHLVYLDVWEREVTFVEAPDLIESAVGVDTTSRLQTAWQVRVLSDLGTGATCATPDDQLGQDWLKTIAPSAGRLTTKGVGVETTDNPCLIPPTGGYRGLENRTYRVEIHDGDTIGTATFKWSRDNASVASGVSAIKDNLTLTVDRTVWDSVRRFSKDDWVEVTDDWREFSGKPGEITQIDSVDDSNRTITLKTPLPANVFADGQNPTDAERHTRIKRWDHSGGDPVIKVPASNTPFILEDGVQITFTTDPDGGEFRPGDYWIFVARTADASVEELHAAPPHGVHHHYCKLAIIETGQVTDDCREFWPPEECCDCTVCVTAEQHNQKTFTIQNAVDQIHETGGKICLGPGIYVIKEPVTIAGKNNIEISGHGLTNLVASGLANDKALFQIVGRSESPSQYKYSHYIGVEDIAFTGPGIGVAISDSFFTRIKRCQFTGPESITEAGVTPMSLGVGFSGVVGHAQVHDCLFNNVKVGIGRPTTDTLGSFSYSLSIQNNSITCTTAGFKFEDENVVQAFLFADNWVSGPIGCQFRSQGLDHTIERNLFAVIPSTEPVNAAIVCASSNIRINNNEIFTYGSSEKGTDGIVLGGAGWMHAVRVSGNRVDGLARHGILIKEGTVLSETVISQNQLLNLGGAGIIMEEKGEADDLNITSNAITSVGMAPGVGTIMAGILLQAATMSNVNVNENSIEAVGTADGSGFRGGIVLSRVTDFRAAGNRIVDIGPPSNVDFSGGIVVFHGSGRLDITDNEVRRTTDIKMLPSKDTSSAYAVRIGRAEDVAIRGNLLESFGATPTVELGEARSCVFTDNQCFLDNERQVGGQVAVLAVLLGDKELNLNAGVIIASNNFVKAPVTPTPPSAVPPPALTPVMSLNPKMILQTKEKTLTVLGNITSGDIVVDGVPLDPKGPWASLNVQHA